MGRSRRKYKKSHPKVRVGLPRKNPHVFKPAFTVPPKLRSLTSGKKWDEKGSVISNYKSLGVVSNPNLLGVRSRTPHIVQSESLQVPPPSQSRTELSEFDPIDSGSDLEEEECAGWTILIQTTREEKVGPGYTGTGRQDR